MQIRKNARAIGRKNLFLKSVDSGCLRLKQAFKMCIVFAQMYDFGVLK
ncbi:hypothetical protein MFFC18_12440 [Mariniblastus fucicola]|uniref:Uncharacterized protein n=1 Tax=Mariniblastus fucicola TaxID=980251 RepID=A0A5B9P4R7_9BACT|nr:hypothetical protein MFFC18_12440 [Mariniblastus fucicola]